MADPNSGSQPARTSFRPVWTLAAVLLVLVMELLRYAGRKPDQEQQPARLRPAPRTVQEEQEQNESLPRKDETIVLPGLEEWGAEGHGNLVPSAPHLPIDRRKSRTTTDGSAKSI